MIFVRTIDSNGLFVEDTFVDELTDSTIETPCPDGFYLPKWDGEKWVEGGTAPTPQPTEPTIEERVGTVESKTATIEETLDVIFGGTV
jgi:hypothetical protein